MTTENIERINQVRAIVEKHMDAMINDIWDASKQTRALGARLDGAEYDLTNIIMNEFITINVCD